MHRNASQSQQNPRHDAERDASQALGGQPGSGDDEDPLPRAEDVRSFLTSREFEARDPSKAEPSGVMDDEPDESDDEEPAPKKKARATK